jgi:RNA recognition motif-containing protein
MPMFKIYVGNLDPRVTIEQIRELFSPFLAIEDAVLAADPKTGKAKGFAIIMVRDPEIGRAAVKATQGKRLLGKTLIINEVMKKGAAAAKAAKEVRQGPFGPHYNRQTGTRSSPVVGGRLGGVRRGMNRGPRGPGLSGGSGFGGSSSGGPSHTSGSRDGLGEGASMRERDPSHSPKAQPPNTPTHSPNDGSSDPRNFKSQQSDQRRESIEPGERPSSGE